MAPRTSKVMIPDDPELHEDPGDVSIVGTTDAEALANSAKLGGSRYNAPTQAVGMPKDDYVTIILDETENMAPTGQTFSLNGKAYMIRPGEPVRIPRGILEVIDHAIQAAPIVDPQTLKVIGHRDRHRFPYRIVNRPV